MIMIYLVQQCGLVYNIGFYSRKYGSVI